jgi:phosphatidylglycerophosphatase A
MWLSLMVTVSTAETISYSYVYLLAIVLSFVSFRLFETWKPSTIGWIDREVKGGLGMMMSSVLAGIAGGLLSAVILLGIDKLF